MKKIGVGNDIDTFSIVLPVGISFFTFQAAGYLIDVYRGEIKAEKNFFQYALFVSFFPQLVAGPIERSKNLLPQLKKTYSFDFDRMKSGLYTMLWGFFLKMVIADRAAIVVNSVYNNYSERTGAEVVLATVLFAFQIYGDFGGYSLIAIGGSRVLGIKLMDNFDAPYLATGTADFWTRWHMSLNNWFRDYLYIPLGGNRKGKVRKYINILIVFLVSGLWHGAEWSFVIWGGLNGLYQIVGSILKRPRRKIEEICHINVKSAGWHICQSLLMFALVDFAWGFFRANSIRDALNMLSMVKNNLAPHSVLGKGVFELGLDKPNAILLGVALLLLLVVDIFRYQKKSINEWILKRCGFIQGAIVVIAVLFIVVTGVWGNAFDAHSFIYFQF